MLDEINEYRQTVKDIMDGMDPADAAAKRLESADEGYSSIEVPEKQSAAEESSEAEVDAAVEPDHEQEQK